MLSKNKLAAHRGLHFQYPENSAPSFWAACRAGAGFVEADICAVADNCLIAQHDVPQRPECDFCGQLFCEHRTTLGEYLEIMARHQNSKPLLDIKDYPDHLQNVEKEICLQLENYGIQEAYIFSFHRPILEKFMRLEHTHKLGVLIPYRSVGYLGLARYLRASLKGLSIDFVGINEKLLNKRTMRLLPDVPVFAYTVNSKRRAKELLEMGVSVIITDALLHPAESSLPLGSKL